MDNGPYWIMYLNKLMIPKMKIIFISAYDRCNDVFFSVEFLCFDGQNIIVTMSDAAIRNISPDIFSSDLIKT
jgi:hypothetical protein